MSAQLVSGSCWALWEYGRNTTHPSPQGLESPTQFLCLCSAQCGPANQRNRREGPGSRASPQRESASPHPGKPSWDVGAALPRPQGMGGTRGSGWWRPLRRKSARVRVTVLPGPVTAERKKDKAGRSGANTGRAGVGTSPVPSSMKSEDGHSWTPRAGCDVPLIVNSSKHSDVNLTVAAGYF